MRIVAGIAGGIRLFPPKSKAIRPTSDRVREAMFAALGPLDGLRVADLFSGSGAIGLEAWSRGAEVVMVEQDSRAAKLIERNQGVVAKAMGDGAPGCRLLRGDALRCHSLLPRWQPDVIVADPPYHADSGPTMGTRLLRNPQFAAWAGDARLVLEQSTRSLPDLSGAKWQLLREKRYGDSALCWYGALV